jgi:ubiquinol-cytochrome c reductase iron-sulfur subunit
MPRRLFSADTGGPIYANFGDRINATGVAPGDWLLVVLDDENPIFIRHRTNAQIQAVRSEPVAGLLDPARDEDRAPDAAWIAVVGICTHAGCKVVAGLGPYDGWACFCHGSVFDASGRVRGGPAQRNLPVVKLTRVAPSIFVTE